MVSESHGAGKCGVHKSNIDITISVVPHYKRLRVYSDGSINSGILSTLQLPVGRQHVDTIHCYSKPAEGRHHDQGLSYDRQLDLKYERRHGRPSTDCEAGFNVYRPCLRIRGNSSISSLARPRARHQIPSWNHGTMNQTIWPKHDSKSDWAFCQRFTFPL